MEYAQLNEAGTEALHVTTHGNVEWDENHFCPASALTPEESEIFRVVPLLETDQPAFDSITQTCIRDGCEKVGDAWQYRWRVDTLSLEQIAINQAAQQSALLAAYDQALTDHLDAVAQSDQWENRITLAVRAGYPNPWQPKAIAFGTWMDSCNALGYQMLADFQHGLIPQPTVAEFVAALPPMIWPVK